MAVDFKPALNVDPDCALCVAADTYTGVMQSYALEFFKASAGYGTYLVSSILTLVIVWELGKALLAKDGGFDKEFLIETTVWCFFVGLLMSHPEDLLNAFFWFFSAGLDMAARGFQVVGGQADVSGMSGLLKTMEQGIKVAFGPFIKSMLGELSIRNLIPLLALLGVLLPLIFLARQLLVHLIAPSFVLFSLACCLYILLVLGIFPQTRRVPANALRIAAAVSMQTMFAGIIVAFNLAILGAILRLIQSENMAAFGNAYMVVLLTIVFMTLSIGPMMAVPSMLFDVIQQNPNTRLWQLTAKK